MTNPKPLPQRQKRLLTVSAQRLNGKRQRAQGKKPLTRRS